MFKKILEAVFTILTYAFVAVACGFMLSITWDNVILPKFNSLPYFSWTDWTIIWCAFAASKKAIDTPLNDKTQRR